jgi:putative radical SAM enzyme (TIGR03279 family)
MKLSVNISVHTTNPQLRCKIMGSKFAGEKLQYLYKIAGANIPINCQIVLCKDWNDGEELFNSLRDLNSFKSIGSIAVVPIGMTKFRENLTQIEPFTKEDAKNVISLTEKFENVYAADEFYLLAGKEIPPNEYYKDYPQYENGVGMLRYHITDFEHRIVDADLTGVQSFSVATGVAAFETISKLCLELQKRTGVQITVFKIKNYFFGESITVAGLLTGTDIINQLKGKNLGDYLQLTSTMLNSDGLFLDNLTIKDIERELKVKVKFQEFLI